MKLLSVETYCKQVICGERVGLLASGLRLILSLLSYLFRLGVWIRNCAFDWGWLRQHRVPVTVVSVGNISVGGTGKTPLLMLLAKEFSSTGRLALLSRGYRSPAEKRAEPLVVSRGHGPEHQAVVCGDEPYLLSDNLPEAMVIAGKNRRAASLMAVNAGVDLIMLDDGMQHRFLARDFDVVVLDAHDPFGRDHFLPAGFLRESPSALKRADLLVINHAEKREDIAAIKKRVQAITDVPIVCTRLKIAGVYDFDGCDQGSITEMRVGILCGIAHPAYFRRSVESLGAEVVVEKCLADHEAIHEKGLLRYAEQCLAAGATLLL